jgi:hypothetical protein
MTDINCERYRNAEGDGSNPNCAKCHGLGKYRIPVDAWIQESVYKDLLEFSKRFKQ